LIKKIPNWLGKNARKPQGVIFLTHTVYINCLLTKQSIFRCQLISSRRIFRAQIRCEKIWANEWNVSLLQQ